MYSRSTSGKGMEKGRDITHVQDKTSCSRYCGRSFVLATWLSLYDGHTTGHSTHCDEHRCGNDVEHVAGGSWTRLDVLRTGNNTISRSTLPVCSWDRQQNLLYDC